MRNLSPGVRCPACFGDGLIDLRDENAILSEHLTDWQLAHVRLTDGWKRPVRPCDECDGTGWVSAARAEALRREAHRAVENALSAIPEGGTT